VFATKLATERPVVVTMLVPHWMQTFEKARSEVKRCLSDVPSQKGEIRYAVSFLTVVAHLMLYMFYHRVVGFGEHSTDLDPAKMASGDPALFDTLWTTLIGPHPLKCSATGTEYPAAAKPTMCVLDVSVHDFRNAASADIALA
jgi:hypothetical protein